MNDLQVGSNIMRSGFSSLSFIDSSLAHAAARAAFQVEKFEKVSDPKSVKAEDLDAVYEVIHYVLESRYSESSPSDPIQHSLISHAVNQSQFQIAQLRSRDVTSSCSLATELIENITSLDSLKLFFLRLSESASRARNLAKVADTQDFTHAH